MMSRKNINFPFRNSILATLKCKAAYKNKIYPEISSNSSHYFLHVGEACPLNHSIENNLRNHYENIKFK